jgi:hypothetical protein
VLPHDHREEHVREAVFERCRALRIEPPSSGRTDRLVRSAFHSFEERWCASVLERLDATTQRALDDLLMAGGADDDRDAEATETRRSGLNELKGDAGANVNCGRTHRRSVSLSQGQSSGSLCRPTTSLAVLRKTGLHKTVTRMLRGFYQYFGIRLCGPTLKSVRRRVRKLWWWREGLAQVVTYVRPWGLARSTGHTGSVSEALPGN